MLALKKIKLRNQKKKKNLCANHSQWENGTRKIYLRNLNATINTNAVARAWGILNYNNIIHAISIKKFCL